MFEFLFTIALKLDCDESHSFQYLQMIVILLVGDEIEVISSSSSDDLIGIIIQGEIYLRIQLNLAYLHLFFNLMTLVIIL